VAVTCLLVREGGPMGEAGYAAKCYKE
jgi:hypothetical protein